jgi:DNA-binding NtrC family response regulator
MNGRQTYEQIVHIQPRQKAIIISGFAETEDVLEAQRMGAGQFLKKPVTLEKLGRAVKQELEK